VPDYSSAPLVSTSPATQSFGSAFPEFAVVVHERDALPDLALALGTEAAL
jgi:hypothetical protein